MLTSLAKIDETISRWEYPIALKQIKKSLHFSETTDELLEYLNTKLLECLDLANFGIHKEISEIVNIIEDEMIFENLNSEQKANLYVALWDNFLKLWNIEDAFWSYNIRFELWNKDVFKEIIFLKIFSLAQLKPKNIEEWLDLSDIVYNIEIKEDSVEYAEILRSEILNFIFWETVYPEDENNIVSQIYKLEAYEFLALKDIVSQNKFTLKELNLIYYQIGQELEKWYANLEQDFSPELIEIPKQNMLKRASWIDTACLYLWEFTKEFISFWFDIIEVYLKSANYEDKEKTLFIIDFLTKYWFKNLLLAQMSYLFDLIDNVVISKENLPDSYIYKLFNILSSNLASWESVPIKSFILMRKIRLILEEYNWVFRALNWARYSWIDVTDKMKSLLESMLLDKEFNSIDESELRFGKYLGWTNVIEVKKQEMDPEILISLILEKINKWQALTEDDYKTIERLTLR